MKNTNLLIGTFSFLVFSGTVPAWAQDQGALLKAELSTITNPIPDNPPAKVSNSQDSTYRTQLAYYAWRLFVAANQGTGASLKSGAGREKAVANFLSTGSKPLFNNGENPLVFESLYHRTEAYPFYTTASARPSNPVGQVPIYRFRANFTVSGTDANYVNLDETNQIGQNMLYFRQSKNGANFPVLYMAKVNSTQVNYVWGRPPTENPTTADSWVFPTDTLEIKSAWRRVGDINSNAATYHQAPATYYVGAEGTTSPTPTTGTNFALIALHIIQKPAGYPQLIFTTFEHVDATTRDKTTNNITDPAFQLAYEHLLYDDNKVGTTPQAMANGAYTVNRSGLAPANNSPQTYNLPTSGQAPPPPAKPDSFVVAEQPKTITKEVNDVNNTVRGWILNAKGGNNSIWANYRLKGVQAVPTSDEKTLDYYLANIVVETSQPGVQLFRGGVVNPSGNPGDKTFYNTRQSVYLSGSPGDPPTDPSEIRPGNISTAAYKTGDAVPTPDITMGGCMGCHGVAQQKGRDFSFVASGAGGSGKSIDSVPSADLTPAEAAAHNKSIMAAKYDQLFR